jgi:hypothetical protein
MEQDRIVRSPLALFCPETEMLSAILAILVSLTGGAKDFEGVWKGDLSCSFRDGNGKGKGKVNTNSSSLRLTIGDLSKGKFKGEWAEDSPSHSGTLEIEGTINGN